MSVFEYNFEQYKSLSPDLYRKEKYNLQVELLKLQEDVIKKKRKIAICFEGRDTAGKSSTINFFSEHLIPSNFNYVHLGIPTKKERKNWFERYETYLPNKGQIVLFDRSWYTRALTEPTLGYCSKKQYEEFMTKVNKWEKSLVKKGTELVKFYFSIDKDQQKRRINARKNSKLKYWKLSESDKLMVNKWDVFTLYKNQMFDLTSTDYAPWVVINANNKMIARLSALRYILNNLTYDEKLSLKPPKWGEDLGNYSLYIEGVLFENLTYEQFKILAPFSD
jgi:polyphosphate kinase 2